MRHRGQLDGRQPSTEDDLSEMEYCASGASMLAEEFWQIVEGFVEVPVNLQAQIKNLEEISRMINNVDSKSYIGKTILWKKCLEGSDILQNVESVM